MTKPIMKICYKLLYVILGVKSIFDKVTSWPQLISKLLVASACLHAASDWPRTFFTPKVFLFSIIIMKSSIPTQVHLDMFEAGLHFNIYLQFWSQTWLQ